MFGEYSSSLTIIGSSLSALTGCVVTLGLAELTRQYIRFRCNPLRQAPGPPPTSYLFGYFWPVLKAPFMKLHQEWWKEAREKNDDGEQLPFFAYSSLLGLYSCVLLDSRLIQTVLTSSYSSSKKSKGGKPRFTKNVRFLRSIGGDGLVVLEDGPDWGRHRRIVQPAFHKGLVRSSVNEAVRECMVQYLLPAWKKAGSQPIQVHSHMSAVTLDVIGKAAFGYDFGGCQSFHAWASACGNDDDDANSSKLPDCDSIKLLQKAFAITPLGVFLALLGVRWVFNLLARSSAKAGATFDKTVESIMEHTRAGSANNIGKTAAPAKSLLEHLLRAREADGDHRQHLSDAELRDEMKTFLVAGHETTSTFCNWILYALAVDKDMQEEVYKELMDGSNKRDYIDSEWMDTHPMPYFRAFLNEVLRFYPPVGMMFRYNSADEYWHGHCIPAGTRLLIPFYLIHRNPDHWDEPEKFWPDRWLSDKPRDKFSFLPFSTGARSCIGNYFAQTEAELIIANIVQSFKISLAPSMEGVTLELTNAVTLKTKPPIEICVEERP